MGLVSIFQSRKCLLALERERAEQSSAVGTGTINGTVVQL